LRLHGRGQRRKSSSRAPPSLPGPSLVRGTRRNNGQSGIITGTDPAGHGPSWQLDGPPSCPLQRRTPDPRPSPARHPLGQGVDHEPRQADDPPTGAGLGRPEVQPALRLGDDLSAKRSSTSSKGRWSTRSRASRRPRSRPATSCSSRPGRSTRCATSAAATRPSWPPMSSRRASRSSPWSSEGQPCGDGYPFLAGIGLDLRPIHRAHPRRRQRLVKPSWSATIDSSGTHVKEQPAGGRPRPPTPCRARVQPKRRFAPLEGYSLAGPGRCSPARAPVEWSGGRWSWLRGQTAGDPGHAARWSAPTSPRSGGRWLRSRRPNAIARDARAGGRRRSTGRYR
jgi:hypothetical protein